MDDALHLHVNQKSDYDDMTKAIGILMQVKSTAECSMGAFCNTFDLH